MIKANISKGNAYADKSVYQYSYGQILRIEGMELPDPVEIHFSTRDTGGDSDRRLGTTIDGATEVAIPDKMLENNGATSDYYIYAFVYIADETHGETVRKIYILVNSRPRPGDLVPPDDPDFAQQLINMVKYKADGLEYKNSILRLMAGETELAQVTISGGSGGDNGITPHIGENGNWYLGEADTGVKASGSDGVTPHIGDNGNWYIGDTDTGVKAEAPSTDSTLTESGKAADAKITGEKISELKGEIEALKNGETGTETPGGASWTTAQIDNLESVLYMMEFSTEALAAEGKTKIDALITSLRNGTSSGGSGEGGGESGGGTEITLTSISAVYNGGEVQEGTSASDLDITVTANYSDGSSAVVSGWSISGTVHEGENSFIVSYGGKTTTVKVTGVKQSATSQYITDGLIFNIDAIDSEITGKSWSDATGNYTTVMSNVCYITDEGTYVNTNVRGQVKVTDTALLTDMGTAFSVEAVWQNRYLNSDGIATDITPGDTAYIFNVGAGNNKMLIASNGKCRILGSNTVYGDAFTSNDDILHCTITYDGTTYSLYHDGTLVTSMSASMDLSSQTYAEFWGCVEWANITYGSFNAGRIYNRCLTADEVKANYDVDIERFGTQNIAAA